ncbi:MAG: hypothetical protein FJZ58_04865 [Chlamydiae bacterium]|nr:hypothetical protein [Chlamydiota bacterium]
MKKAALLTGILVVILLSIYTSFSIIAAAGGGGDPSPSPSPSGDSTGSSSYSHFSRYGSVPLDQFINLKCTDAGSISFIMRNNSEIFITREGKAENISYTGTWQDDTFTSDEVIFNEAAKYLLRNKKTSASVLCPGFAFSCVPINFTEVSCSRDGSVLKVRIVVQQDPETSNLKFNFGMGKRVLSYAADARNLELKELSVKRDGEAVELTLPNSPAIDLFEVVHQKCIGKRYLYARVNCISSPSAASAASAAANAPGQQIAAQARVDPKSLKCGGLLDIADRVRCRINLEREQDEYENFYPEECTNHRAPDRCLGMYRAVSECWDIKPYQGRVSCLANKLGYDKTKICESTDNACTQEQNDKLLTLVKLRFYNLEEQAEMLEEQGRLDKDKLIAFVVKIENKKKEFNEAKTKSEMRQIVLDVRAHWKELMREVKFA